MFLAMTFNCSFANDLLEPLQLIEIRNTPKQNPEYFNLANIVDTILNSNEYVQKPDVSEDTTLRKSFLATTEKFNQGNALNAYNEYKELISKTDKDLSLLNLADVFYSVGFFSLAKEAQDKIINKNQYLSIIQDLEKSNLPAFGLSREDEIFFAKLYSSIFYDNSSQEALDEIIKQKNQYKNNDYYHYISALAYLDLKKYSKAYSSINKAIKLNEQNVNYKLTKADILIAQNKNSQALSLLKTLEKQRLISARNEIIIKKQIALMGASKNEKEKKYHSIMVNYLEGNFEKTKKDCLTILNFDKDNDKILSLYAKAELALGNIERANTYFLNSYKLNKSNLDTLIGLGDINYIHKDYKNSIKMYKKALKNAKDTEAKVEILIKLAVSQREYAKTPKELRKTELLVDKYSSDAYLSYYKSAISIAQKNPVLKEDFLKRSSDINPLFKNATGELIELDLKNKNYKTALGLINTVAFTLEKNYYYYYLCGQYNEYTNKKQDAIQFYKTSLNLNPSFEAANHKLLNLVSNERGEEI